MACRSSSLKPVRLRPAQFNPFVFRVERADNCLLKNLPFDAAQVADGFVSSTSRQLPTNMRHSDTLAITTARVKTRHWQR